MSTNEANPSPENIPPDVSPTERGAPPLGPTPPQPLPTVRVWASTLAAGLIAGFVVWLIWEPLHDRFQPRLLNTAGFPSVEEMQADARNRQAATTLQATLAFGLLGAVLGLALGGAGGVARRSARSGFIAALFGTIVGAIAGAVTTQALLPIYFQFYDPDSDDLLLAITIQGGICAVIGAVGGAALGLGLGGWSLTVRTMVGGLVGAIAGVLVYQMVGALAFPLDETTKPLSNASGTRLLARLAVTILAAVGAAKAAVQQSPPTKPARH